MKGRRQAAAAVQLSKKFLYAEQGANSGCSRTSKRLND
jgi:hypothetical protein